MAGRTRRGREEPLPVRAARERAEHLDQVGAYPFLAGRGPRRSVTVVPRPLRYWQYDAPRPTLFVVVLVVVAAWLGAFAWVRGAAGVADEAPLAVGLGIAVLVLSSGRLTVSDSGLSTDIAGLRRTTSFGVVPRILVREIRVGGPAQGWPRAKRRGGWWPGRTRLAVRYLGPDGAKDQAFTQWVRDPEAFAGAFGVPLSAKP